MVSISDFAEHDSEIHKMDPRIKLTGFGLFLLCTSLVSTLAGAVAAFGMAWLMVIFARFPVRFVIRRMTPIVFFLSTFYLILPFSHPIGVQAGVIQASTILLKGTSMILTIFPMFGTTPFDLTMKGLERLKVSPKFITLIFFTVRYFAAYADRLQTLRENLQSRGFQPGADLRTFRVFGNLTGSLLVQSFEQTERIYQAMLCRGYCDHFVTLHEFSAITNRDRLKFGLLVLISSALILFDRSWIGGLPWSL